MVKPLQKNIGWEFIPEKEKELIKESLIKLQNRRPDRKDYLDILFDMYNLYMGGTYKESNKTCSSCVSKVKKTFQKYLD